MPSIDPQVRGEALVASVIELVEKGRSDIPIHQLRPLPADALAALTPPGGAPLPPSLRMWLAYDTSFLMRSARWFVPSVAAGIPGARLPDLVAQELPGAGAAFESLASTLLPAPCVRLSLGDGSSFQLLYLGQPDAAGEYPVLSASATDQPIVELDLPGFDVWIAVQAGLVARKQASSVFKVAMAEQAHLNLGGCLFRENLDGWKGRSVKRPPMTLLAAGTPAPMPALAKVKRKGPLLPGEAPRTVEALLGLMEEAAELGEDDRIASLRAVAESMPKGRDKLAGAMRAAVMNGSVALVRCLLDLGVAVDEKDQSGMTPLFVACLNGHEAIVRLLLERGADPNVGSEDDGQAPLHIACANMRQLVDLRAYGAVVRALCAGGAEVDAVDQNNLRPVEDAASAVMPGSGAEPLVALLQAGARLDAPGDRPGLLWRAIHGYSRKGGCAAAVRALLAAGADPNEVADDGDPPRRVAPLRVAFEQISSRRPNEARAIVKVLVEGGADRERAGLAHAIDADGSVRTG